jgi:hypothetical protein
MAQSPPTSDIGHLAAQFSLGGGIDASYVDVSEAVADLEWPLSVTTYSRMRRDPKLTAVLGAVTLPIRRASWAIDPAGCRDEVAQLVADDLGLPILGSEDEPGAARRRGVIWAQHLRMALGCLTWGHMPFEQRYEVDGSRAHLVALSERLPSTIRQIVIGKGGELAGIKQDITGDTLIPENRLVWYVHDREGAAWQGQSLLRPAFGAWLLKHEMWRVHATSIRRFGMGVPGVTAPAGATPGQVAEAQRLASAARVGETGGIGLPAGFEFKITGLTGTVPDALAYIRYLDQQMSEMALAGFLDLANTTNGSRAMSESFVDLFMLSIQAIAEDMATTATALAVQMTDYNFGEDEAAPKVCVADVGTRHEVTAESLGLLLGSGALSRDPELEAFVREEWNLPERATPDGTYDAAGGYASPEPPPALPPGPPVAAAAGMVHHWKHGWIPLDSADAADASSGPMEKRVMDVSKVEEYRMDHHVNEEHVAALARQMKDAGKFVGDPLIIQDTNTTPLLTDGDHRLHAAKLAGIKEVPVEWYANTEAGRLASLKRLNEAERRKTDAPAADAAGPAKEFAHMSDGEVWAEIKTLRNSGADPGLLAKLEAELHTRQHP